MLSSTFMPTETRGRWRSALGVGRGARSGKRNNLHHVPVGCSVGFGMRFGVKVAPGQPERRPVADAPDPEVVKPGRPNGRFRGQRRTHLAPTRPIPPNFSHKILSVNSGEASWHDENRFRVLAANQRQCVGNCSRPTSRLASRLGSTGGQLSRRGPPDGLAPLAGMVYGASGTRLAMGCRR